MKISQKSIDKINDIAGKTISACNEFFNENKYNLIITFLTAIIVYITVLGNFTIGLDSEKYLINTAGKMYYNEGKFGLYHILKFMPNIVFSSYSVILAIAALTICGSLITYKLQISQTAKIVFSALFISYPLYIFIFHFYFQAAAMFIPLLFMVFAIYITDRAFTNKKRLITVYLFSLFFIYWAVSAYQAHVAFFISIVMYRAVIHYNDDKPVSFIIKYLMTMASLIVSTVIIYKLHMKYLGINVKKYQSEFFDYGALNITETLKYVFAKLTGTEANYEINIIAIIFLLLAFISYVYHIKNIKKSFFMLFLLISFTLSCAFIQLIAVKNTLVRYDTSLSLLTAGAVSLLIIFNKSNSAKLIAVTSAVIMIIYSGGIISRVQQTEITAYENDKIIISKLIDNIYDKVPDVYHNKDKYKIALFGVFPHSPSDHIYRTSFDSEKLTGNMLSFGWEYRIRLFMMYMGFPKVRHIEHNKMHIYWEEAKRMPIFPDKNSVKLIDDTIVIHISDNGANISNVINRINASKLNEDTLLDINNGYYFTDGWAGSEKTHRWSIGNKSKMFIPLSVTDKDINITMQFTPFFHKEINSQEAVFNINGIESNCIMANNNWDGNICNITVPKENIGKDGILNMDMTLKNKVSSPALQGSSGDTRMLGAALQKFIYQTAQ